jgi:hypothetical protein
MLSRQSILSMHTMRPSALQFVQYHRMSTETPGRAPGVPKVVYHWKTKDFRGGSIVDLYTLRARMPELFEGQSAKYQTTSVRKHILANTMIPNLGCLWNAAVHTSTVHPQIILDAKRRHGLPIDNALVGQQYFTIPVQKLLDDPKVQRMVHWDFPNPTPMTLLGFALNVQQLRGVLGQWNAQDFQVLDQHYLDHTFANRTALSPHSEVVYAKWGAAFRNGEAPQVLTYQGMPHVLVLGEIETDGLEIIEVS